MVKLLPAWMQFLSTPSARRGTAVKHDDSVVDHISIHALREEGDPHQRARWGCQDYFYPRSPRGGRHPKGRQMTEQG